MIRGEGLGTLLAAQFLPCNGFRHRKAQPGLLFLGAIVRFFIFLVSEWKAWLQTSKMDNYSDGCRKGLRMLQCLVPSPVGNFRITPQAISVVQTKNTSSVNRPELYLAVHGVVGAQRIDLEHTIGTRFVERRGSLEKRRPLPNPGCRPESCRCGRPC